MSSLGKFHMAILALLLAGGMLLVPPWAEARETPWLLRVKALITYHQEIAKPQGFGHVYAPYLEQLEFVRWLVTTGEQGSAFGAWKDLREMLQFDMEKGGGGIPTWSAKDLLHLWVEMTPPLFHASEHQEDFSGYRA